MCVAKGSVVVEAMVVVFMLAATFVVSTGYGSRGKPVFMAVIIQRKKEALHLASPFFLL